MRSDIQPRAPQSSSDEPKSEHFVKRENPHKNMRSVVRKKTVSSLSSFQFQLFITYYLRHSSRKLGSFRLIRNSCAFGDWDTNLVLWLCGASGNLRKIWGICPSCVRKASISAPHLIGDGPIDSLGSMTSTCLLISLAFDSACHAIEYMGMESVRDSLIRFLALSICVRLPAR